MKQQKQIPSLTRTPSRHKQQPQQQQSKLKLKRSPRASSPRNQRNSSSGDGDVSSSSTKIAGVNKTRSFLPKNATSTIKSPPSAKSPTNNTITSNNNNNNNNNNNIKPQSPSSSSSSSPAEKMTIHLSTLFSLRASKQTKLKSLLEEYQSIQTQMKNVKKELNDLEEDIQVWEEKIRQSVGGSDENEDDARRKERGNAKKKKPDYKEEEDYVFQVTGEEEGDNSPTTITAGGKRSTTTTMTWAPDEVLTDPLTMTKGMQDDDDDESIEEAEFTLTPQPPPPPTPQNELSTTATNVSDKVPPPRTIPITEEEDPEINDMIEFYQDMEAEEQQQPSPPTPLPEEEKHNAAAVHKNHDVEEYIPDDDDDHEDETVHRGGGGGGGSIVVHHASTASGLIPTNTLAPQDAPLRSSTTMTSSLQQSSSSSSSSSSLRHFKQSQQQQQLDQFMVATQHRPTKEDRNAAYMRELATDNFPWSEEMMLSLRNIFKIRSFRDHQKEIINCTMSGDDVFVIMRTGGGKSLTYQLPALLEGRGQERKVTVVISPLLSLIRDQEDQMNEFVPGSALSFTSGMVGGAAEHHRRWSLVRDRDAGVVIIFVTPEKVHKSNKLRSELQKLHERKRLGRIVIDECHCACQWGHDFRPDYTKLGVLKTMFPDVPLIAVTATASDRVRVDCCKILRLGTNYQFFRSSADRPNLRYIVREKADLQVKVVEEMVIFIRENHRGNAGIIYTFSRKEADEVADRLCGLGIVARSYHSSVNDSAKDQIHRSWMRNETQVVVATIAFGLGINKPDVRFVLHHSLSKSLESYYQESGRAGRDGKPADCVLYYSPKDVFRMLGMIHGDNGESAFWSMARYGQRAGEDAVCRSIILNTLGEPACEDAEEVSSRGSSCSEERDVGKHASVVTKLVSKLISDGEDVSLTKLVKIWRSKKLPDIVKEYPPGREVTKDECERIIISLMIEDILHPKVVYNSYSANVYITMGPRGFLLTQSENPVVKIHFPKRRSKLAAKRKVVHQEDSGWISRNPGVKRKSTVGARGETTKSITKKKKSRRSSNPRHDSTIEGTKRKSQGAEVIELDISSDEDNETLMTLSRKKTRTLSRGKRKKHLEIWDESSESDFSS